MDKLDEVMLQSQSVARVSNDNKILVQKMTEQMTTIITN
jgi:hypothetical protein